MNFWCVPYTSVYICPFFYQNEAPSFLLTGEPTLLLPPDLSPAQTSTGILFSSPHILQNLPLISSARPQFGDNRNLPDPFQ